MHGLAGTGAILGLAGAAMVERSSHSSFWPLGPLPGDCRTSGLCDVADDELCGVLRCLFTSFGGRYPWMADHLGPALRGVDEAERNGAVSGLRGVLSVLEEADLLGVSVGPGGEYHDVLGQMYTALRSDASRSHLGAFFTPPGVAGMLGLMAGALEQGQAVLDPTCGSGGLLLATAVATRDAGIDLQACGWFGIDVDEYALLCASFNAVIWGLGPYVFLHRGDGLSDYFATPSGEPMGFDLVLANPPFAGKWAPESGEAVIVDVVGRRRAMGLNDVGTGRRQVVRRRAGPVTVNSGKSARGVAHPATTRNYLVWTKSGMI